ncbi:hypothetical protein Ciccas_001562 [Cichlidogyrus casuarinus]|uniref:Transporter n=1 Tax=Cichlidogyrus casuarinus TaxID=1844966 RepID=A0ABD2QJR2_9PLAT
MDKEERGDGLQGENGPRNDGSEIEVVYDLKEQNVDRATWGGKVEFMMACIGYAVGLGNVWRFPNLCFRNGGGAFLIPYCLMVAVIGLPLFFLEFAFGQFASLGPIEIWSISPLFKGIGYSMVLISWVLCAYYNVIVARCMFFFGASFQSELPWSNCNNTWNTPSCLEFVTICTYTCTFSYIYSEIIIFFHYLDGTNRTTPSQEYYQHFVLEFSGSLNDFGFPVWKMVLALMACWIIVCIALIKGVQSLGKVSYFTAIFPYVVLFSMFVRACMLEGAMDGLYYYLKPDWAALLNFSVWTDAATQIFFSLSVCNGGLIAMSSFNKFKNNCYHDSVIIVIINCLTSVFSGLVVFANLGHMALKKNVPITEVANEGSGLVFVVYPEALLQMPGSIFWSIIFFLMMLTLGLGSQFSMTECVLSGLQDLLVRRKILKTHLSTKMFRVGMCVLNFLLGIPMVCRGGSDLLDLIDTVFSSYPLLFVALCEIITVSYLYGINQFKKDVALMIKSKPNWYWRINWLALTPAVTLILLILTLSQQNPQLAKYPAAWQIFAQCIASLVVSVIPIYFLVSYCRNGGLIVLRELLKPKQKWGPANKSDREEFHNMIRSNDSVRQSKMVSKVSNKSFIQMVGGTTGAGSTYNISSSIISRNGGFGLTATDELGGSGFYQSKLSIADKIAEQYTKSLVKTNPELASLLINPNVSTFQIVVCIPGIE